MADDSRFPPLATLFAPRSVAIVGASEKSAWTATIARSMQAYGVEGPVFAVNRNGVPAFGMPGFTSCSHIPQPVDAAYICVPLDAVEEAIEDIARAGVKAAVVLTSGFGEAGADGANKERRMLALANQHGIRLLGPNCLGFANIAARTALTSILPRGELLPAGDIAFVCQSGATAAEILEFTQQQGIAVNFFAATGNEAQISIADLIDYLVDDPATRVIMVFAETIRNAARFAEAAKRALQAAKPIVILKVGASELSASVAKAHTGSLVGDDRVFSAACRQLGVIRVHSLEDLAMTASLLSQTGPLRPGGVGIASISGGACTLIGDRAETESMALPVFSTETVSALRTVLPDYANTLNPLDVTGAAVRDVSILEKSLAILARDPAIAIRLCVLNLPNIEGQTTPSPQMLAAVGAGLRSGDTPGLLCVQTLKPVTAVSRRVLRDCGIPGVIGGLDHAVRALSRALWWSERQRTTATRQVWAPAWSVPLQSQLTSERAVLDYLTGFDVPVVPAILARTAEEAVKAAGNWEGRVALKIASPDIAHKTEVGGVKLLIEGDDAVAQAFRDIMQSVQSASPQARIDGIIVSPMRERGIELFVGTTYDADWGCVLAVGLGGIWVEALQDTATHLLPVERDDVITMLRSLRAAKILQGFRGAPAADLDALADVIVRIGHAALALGPQLDSLEINPLFVQGKHVEALDGLLTWKAAANSP